MKNDDDERNEEEMKDITESRPDVGCYKIVRPQVRIDIHKRESVIHDPCVSDV